MRILFNINATMTYNINNDKKGKINFNKCKNKNTFKDFSSTSFIIKLIMIKVLIIV